MGVNINDLERRIVGPAAKLTIHPLDALLRIVFRISKEIIKPAAAEKLHHTVFAPAFGPMEV